jgi:hypothetical protein
MRYWQMRIALRSGAARHCIAGPVGVVIYGTRHPLLPPQLTMMSASEPLQSQQVIQEVILGFVSGVRPACALPI